MMLAIPTVIAFNATTQTVEAYSSGWHKDGKGWWYATSNRSWHANRWAKINNKWYHFKANGYMTTGWLKAGNKWYYLHGGNNGSMATGWLQLGGKWYYLNGGDDGSMATGWVKWNNQWYYLRGGNDGSMVTNAWVKTGGKEYYLEGSGAMATNKWVKDWYVGNDGAWIPNPRPIYTTKTRLVDDLTRPKTKTITETVPSTTEFDYVYGSGYANICNVCETVLAADHPDTLPEFKVGFTAHFNSTGHMSTRSNGYDKIPIGKTPKMITTTREVPDGYHQKEEQYQEITGYN